jgi:hypothetical protein
MRLWSIVLLESAPLALVHETRTQIGRDVLLFAGLRDVAVGLPQGVLDEGSDMIFRLPVVLLLAGLSDVAVDSPQGVLGKSPRSVPRLPGVHWLSVGGVTVSHGGGRVV